jgi:hypothetical protein
MKHVPTPLPPLASQSRGPGSFFNLSQLVVARSDRRLFPVCYNALEPELARVVEDGSGCRLRWARFRGKGCKVLTIQNDSGLPRGRADHSVLG